MKIIESRPNYNIDHRRYRQTERLYALGPRPVYEAMLEIADGAGLDSVLARYSRLDPEIVYTLDGNGFSPMPLYSVST